MMKSAFRVACLVSACCWFVVASAPAQVATGSIAGIITDMSGGVLPGVTVSVSGPSLIGGAQTAVTDAAGGYRFDRLPPGAYDLKAELQGFKAFERKEIRISASFVATITIQLEVGQIEETITVAGESPTVDVKSNVQQTVMSQEILEGIPTGRDLWSLAKIIPGVQISTYDVGGTQSYQQSAMSSHGSFDVDKTFAIDGQAVNWPGAGGGSTMMYYDQAMFEEVNYQTSAIPAEVSTGGIFMNMVTKNAGNKWRGDAKYYYANDNLQWDNSKTDELKKWNFPGGNPIIRLWDFNVSGGGPIKVDRIWVTGSFRNWRVDKSTLGARNPDGSPTVDDNALANYSGKLLWQMAADHRLSFSWNHSEKDRGHRRDVPPIYVEDRASLHQTNPANSFQVKYTGIRRKLVFESTSGGMIGVTNYYYQDEVKPTDIRIEDIVRSTGLVAAPRHEELPNYRLQFDNALSYAFVGFGGSHLLKGGVQYARLQMHDKFWVNGDMYILFADGAPNAVRVWNTPTSNLSLISWLGFFAQDAWTIGSKLTLNVGMRVDRATGWIPAQSNPAGTFVGERRLDRRDVTNQTAAVWRTGLAYDLFADGGTALKASYSRYAQQVGLNRIQTVHPFAFSSGTRAWTDRNGDRIPQPDELGTFSGFAEVANRYVDSNGPDWPYSDEVTAGVERELVQGVRVGAMYYHRANRKLVGFRNGKVPSSAYTPVTVTVPGSPTGPGGSVTFYNLSPAYFGAAFLDNVYDNQDILDTDYNGVEFTVSKRLTGHWQALAGLTIGKHEGGVAGGDLNDPNNALNFPDGIVGDDSLYALRAAGSYLFPGDVTLSGSLIANNGYPYQSTYTVTRSVYPTLTRSSQTVRLTRRGEQRLPDVVMVDLRLSKTFRLPGGRRLTPQFDLFNVGNASTIVRYSSSVGSNYLAPGEILSPRVVRVGFSFDF